MTRTGGEVLIDSLVALGATRGFGVPGESYLAVLDAIYDRRDRFDFVLCRQEGGAAFMAAAAGKLTGAPGICFVTRGPGATNAAIGVHSAMQDSAPMILFVGQIGRGMRDREAFQEIDYRAMFGTVAKWVTEIDDAGRVAELVSRAWTVATTGRPGPVVVALPEDMLTETTEASPISGPLRVAAAQPDAEAVADALEILRGAERPAILIGGSDWSAAGQAALKAFAEASDLPVVAAFRYQDQFDNHSRAYVGDASVGMVPHVQRAIRDCDVLLAIGVRFGENVTHGYTLLDVPQPKQRLIHVHASDREIGKVYRPEIGIVADSNAFAKALSPVEGPWGAWRSELRTAFDAILDLGPQPGDVDMGAVMAHLREVLPGDAILTNGAGNFAIWPNRFFRFGPGQRLLAPQSGSMGYGVPAAVAAKIIRPEATVVCIAGDGDFQMNGQEISTARQAGAAIIVIVVNNGTYGTIRVHQERHYPGRVSGTEIANPDFAAIARAHGMLGETVTRTADFADAFARARASETGAILELVVDREGVVPGKRLSEISAGA